MTHVAFFVLSPQIRGDRFLLACHLAERFQGEKQHLYIHTEGEDATCHMNRLLWTFRQGSFIPHGLAGTEEDTTVPVSVLIGHHQPPLGSLDRLMNLTHEVPDFFHRFTEVVEPLDQDPAVREAGRARFRFYRERGLKIITHNDFLW
ncbi:MAG: DNA polymerase III subunit chi [Pseudomonadota bacterium]